MQNNEHHGKHVPVDKNFSSSRFFCVNYSSLLNFLIAFPSLFCSSLVPLFASAAACLCRTIDFCCLFSCFFVVYNFSRFSFLSIKFYLKFLAMHCRKLEQKQQKQHNLQYRTKRRRTNTRSNGEIWDRNMEVVGRRRKNQ
jgi:hypothetical protein